MREEVRIEISEEQARKALAAIGIDATGKEMAFALTAGYREDAPALIVYLRPARDLHG